MEMQQVSLVMPFRVNTLLENPSMPQEKEIKAIQIGNQEVKLSLFEDDIIPKEFIKKWMELTDEFSNVSEF